MAAMGALSHALYWRTLPWDHAPGTLLAEEVGLTVARLDGSEYRPWDGRSGLLTAAGQAVWDARARFRLTSGRRRGRAVTRLPPMKAAFVA